MNALENARRRVVQIEQLDRIAYAQSDLAAAIELNTEQRELFRVVFDNPNRA